MELKLSLHLPPSVNSYLGYKVVWVAGRNIAQPYQTKIAKDYKNHIKAIASREIKNQNWKCKDKNNYLEVELVFYLDRKRKDSHNLEKVLFDSLMDAGVYPDDDILLPVTKNIYIDKINPRVEITIRKSNKIGIFDNLEHFKRFKELNCDKCKKSNYKKGCSLMKKLLDNRLEPQINLIELNCYDKTN